MTLDMNLRNFREFTYKELQDINLENKLRRRERNNSPKPLLDFLRDQYGIKAVTVCFSDLEGRLHALDYDKKFFLQSHQNLTFDGSSIRGFTLQAESDLRLGIDWNAWYVLPSDVFAPGKILVFGMVQDKDGKPFPSDLRAKLKDLCESGEERLYASFEIEGFLFQGQDAEQRNEFEFVTQSGYFGTLPRSRLREFIDRCGEIQRCLGFENEKDHGEVAPSQFEMNWKYVDAIIAADQVQLYKLVCRQVASLLGCTASFLPKPVTGVNGNGMHTNLSISNSEGNTFAAPQTANNDVISDRGREFINGILSRAYDLCLVLNSSVNSYRRLDPHYEAPNEVFASAVDRGAMIRIPLADEKSARVEVRSVAADSNPYLLLYCLFKAGMTPAKFQTERHPLPADIYSAITWFKISQFMREILTADVQDKYAQWKQASADRCPRQLGSLVKDCEIKFHHEVTNQSLWSEF